MIAAEFQNITKTYHHQEILKNVNFKIESGVFAVIFGPPGCGKSVLLRLLTGLERPTAGTIYMRGADVTDVTSGERSIGYVPQSFALYPHFRVYDNIAYPLRLVGEYKTEIDPAVRRAAEMLRIKPLLNKYPDQLSGGEKQRVALARGITKKTEIYVFDDPLSGLDFKLREQLIDDLKQMQESLGATFVYTTSDPLEALMLAEKIFILDKGEIIEYGLLEEVYYNPMHIRTMEILGFPRSNILSGRLLSRQNRLWCKTQLFELPIRASREAFTEKSEKEIYVTMRPQAISLGQKRIDKSISFQARIVLKEDLGGELVVHLEAEGTRLLSVVREEEAHFLSDNEIIAAVPFQEIVLYSKEDNQRIGQGGD